MKTTNNGNWIKTANSYFLKMLIIGFLILMMFIPIGMIKSLIGERYELSEEATRKIEHRWGGVQAIHSPMLVVPYTYKDTEIEEYQIDKGKIVKQAREVDKNGLAYFLPEDLQIEGELNPEVRSYGIHETVVYQSDLSIRGYFNFPETTHIKDKDAKLVWESAYLLLNIDDIKGIKSRISLSWKGVQKEMEKGMMGQDFRLETPLNPAMNRREKLSFDINFLLNGSNELYFVPMGKSTQVMLKSKWSSPSFVGSVLPDNREVSEQGFLAKWNAFDYNRAYPQMWVNRSYVNELEISKFGVELQMPFGHYQETMRTVKYAALFICLTFLVFFLVEIISKKRIHPMQYLLVSLAMIIFYTLLLAISERLNFGLSYLISAVSVVVLITSYSYSIFKGVRLTAVMGIFVTLLYGILYMLLQLEDVALLVGSIILFVALAAVMYASRKVDWFNLGTLKTNTSETAGTPPPVPGSEKE